MVRVPVGIKIRQQRKAMGLAQNALAAQVGISASYLNLIERGKRDIGGALLGRIATQLRVQPAALDSASERRLMNDLAEITVDPLIGDLPLDASLAGEIAGRYPQWARALVMMHRACVDRGEAVAALTDRLNQDPFLSDALHRMLTNIAAIRSVAEILATERDIAPAQIRRFHKTLAAQSTGLSEVARALVAFFDADHARTRSLAPARQVDDFLAEHENYFAPLEDAAARLRANVTDDTIEPWLEACIAKMEQQPGLPDRAAMRRESHRFHLAQRMAAHIFAREIDVLVDNAILDHDAARRRARQVLASYGAAALLFPYEPFLQHAEDLRYDVDALARAFNGSVEQICHRLTSLRRPGASGVPFAFLRADPAGQISKRLPLPDLPLPRHGGGCPIWVVHRAFQRPGTIIARLARFPDNKTFLMIARTVEKGFSTFGAPPHLLSVMLACDVLHADRVVYADGMDLSRHDRADPVGPSCRLCVRDRCRHRADDALIETMRAQRGA